MCETGHNNMTFTTVEQNIAWEYLDAYLRYTDFTCLFFSILSTLLLTKDVKTKIKNDECFATLEVQVAIIKFKVDTGSQANTMPVNKLEQLKPRPYVDQVYELY